MVRTQKKIPTQYEFLALLFILVFLNRFNNLDFLQTEKLFNKFLKKLV